MIFKMLKGKIIRINPLLFPNLIIKSSYILAYSSGISLQENYHVPIEKLFV